MIRAEARYGVAFKVSGGRAMKRERRARKMLKMTDRESTFQTLV